MRKFRCALQTQTFVGQSRPTDLLPSQDPRQIAGVSSARKRDRHRMPPLYPNDRFREGFRMPAGRDLATSSTGGEGRRPKASEEGTRGPLVGCLPSMGI